MSETNSAPGSAQDGRADGDIRVRFGPLPNQTVPLEWAESMLTEWAMTKRVQFGNALRDAALAGLDEGGES